jgi:hypothetical protein
MKKQITIQGFAYCKPADSWAHDQANTVDGFTYNFIHTSFEKVEGFIHAGTSTLVIETPDDFDPRAGAVESLKDKKQKLMAEFQARMVEIDRQISRFTAIECAT